MSSLNFFCIFDLFSFSEIFKVFFFVSILHNVFIFANVVTYVFWSICICIHVCICMSVLMCPLLMLVGTTLSCLSAHVNAKPAQIKHDDVFLNM